MSDSASVTPSEHTRLTHTEERDLRAAFERDRWAGEWNSLPTAIDRMLENRATRPNGPVPVKRVKGIKPWWIETMEGRARVLIGTTLWTRLLGGAVVTHDSAVIRVFVGPFARSRAVRFAERRLRPHAHQD